MSACTEPAERVDERYGRGVAGRAHEQRAPRRWAPAQPGPLARRGSGSANGNRAPATQVDSRGQAQHSAGLEQRYVEPRAIGRRRQPVAKRQPLPLGVHRVGAVLAEQSETVDAVPPGPSTAHLRRATATRPPVARRARGHRRPRPCPATSPSPGNARPASSFVAPRCASRGHQPDVGSAVAARSRSRSLSPRSRSSAARRPLQRRAKAALQVAGLERTGRVSERARRSLASSDRAQARPGA